MSVWESQGFRGAQRLRPSLEGIRAIMKPVQARSSYVHTAFKTAAVSQLSEARLLWPSWEI